MGTRGTESVAARLGWRLRELRVAKGLTQRQLAAALALANHGDISLWEQGKRPMPKHHLVRLARVLGGDAEELELLRAAAEGEQRARRSGPAGFFARNWAPIGNVGSRHRTRAFVGRRDELDALGGDLETGRGAAAVITGLAGMGKTQLALAYAAERSHAYDVVWLVPASEPQAIPAELGRLAPLVGLDADARDAVGLAGAVVEELNRRPRWLVIFDDAAGPEVVRPYVATDGGGHVLITSRTQAWRALARPIVLGPLSATASAELLRRRSGRQGDPHAVVRLLAGLPLALEQAASVIEATGIGFADYAARLAAAPAFVLDRGQADLHAETVGRTFSLALDHAVEGDRRAADVIAWLGFLGAGPVPCALLVDPGQPDALGRLHQMSLIGGSGDDVEMHPLLQLLVRASVPAATRADVVATLGRRLLAALPESGTDPGAWSTYGRLLPHVLALVRHSEGVVDAGLAKAASRISGYLAVRGQHTEAMAPAEAALAMLRELPGEEDALADVLHNVGSLHLNGERTAEARGCLDESLELRRRLHGDRHLRVAGTLDSLARCLFDEDRHADAVPLLEEALAIVVDLQGATHPYALVIRGNLSLACDAVGDIERTYRLRTESLALAQRGFTAPHPLIADAHFNVAVLDHPALSLEERVEHGRAARAMYNELDLRDDPFYAELSAAVVALEERLR